MLTRVLAIATALLGALVIHQYTVIGELRSEVAAAETRALVQARATVATSMDGQGAEIQRMITWLDGFYRSSDGLGRPQGLWINGRPDYEGLSVWVFDVYLRRRLRGDSEEDARKAVETALKRSDEWRSKHRS